jgi:hypothetical protein
VITQGNLYSLLALITPRIIDELARRRLIHEREAARLLYDSTLYQTLEQESTKLWHLSAFALTDLLEDELDRQTINWPEEQS